VSSVFSSVYCARPALASVDEQWKWLRLAIFVCFLPVGSALFQGQDSKLLLVIFTAAFSQ
jgi:hypothetical protein